MAYEEIKEKLLQEFPDKDRFVLEEYNADKTEHYAVLYEALSFGNPKTFHKGKQLKSVIVPITLHL